MYNKFELIVGGISILFMVLAVYLVQVESVLFKSGPAGSVPTSQSASLSQALTDQYLPAVASKDNLNNMIIDDIKTGSGAEVKSGDQVSVHYAGTFQDGTEFDNSKKRGAPFEFKVGASQVIKGWDEGLVGMKVGGERVLVVPPEKAYGEKGIGPIPGNSTLVFTIELLDIK